MIESNRREGERDSDHRECKRESNHLECARERERAITWSVRVRLDSLRYCWIRRTTSADSISMAIAYVQLVNNNNEI